MCCLYLAIMRAIMLLNLYTIHSYMIDNLGRTFALCATFVLRATPCRERVGLAIIPSPRL